MALGENPKTVYHSKNQAPVTRMATAAIIREQLSLAKRYDQDWQNSKAGKCDPPELDIKCEALLPVIKGELPVHFHAHRLDDIFTAGRIAKEYNLKFVIIHGTQAILRLIARGRAERRLRPANLRPLKPERGFDPVGPFGSCQCGIEFAIVSDHPVVPTVFMRYALYIAVRKGCHEQALKAMTLSPRGYAADDRVGSIPLKGRGFGCFPTR